MALLHRAGPDIEVLALFEESGRNVERAALLLRDLLLDYPERADLARDLVLCEHEGDRSIDVYIHKLRVKLEQALPDARYIHTHVGFGYRFAPEPSRAFHIQERER